MDTIVQVDAKGRILIPSEFREVLDIKGGDEILLTLDAKTKTLIVSPIYSEEGRFVKIEIEFDDTIGALAKIADYIARKGVDLVMTESKSFQRWKRARWIIIADISRSNSNIKELQEGLLGMDFVKNVSIEEIERDLVHRG